MKNPEKPVIEGNRTKLPRNMKITSVYQTNAVVDPENETPHDPALTQRNMEAARKTSEEIKL